MTEPHYKRGTIRKDGKLYGRYPDGSPTPLSTASLQNGLCALPEVTRD